MLDEGSVFCVLRLPAPWPPGTVTVLVDRRAEGGAIQISADTQGRLTVRLADAAGAVTRSQRFAPLAAATGPCIVAASWTPTTMGLFVNGTEVANEDDANPSVVLAPRAAPTPGDLFLETLDDLAARMASGTWYDAIRAAGLLRQVLLDGDRLVHVVNRAFHLKFSFVVIDHTDPVPVLPDYHWVNLDPTNFAGARTRRVNLDALLASPCLTVKGVTATVADLITACANAKGGIHLGRTRTVEGAAILDWDEAIRLLGEVPSTVAVRGLCGVVLEGLRPLAAAVRAGKASEEGPQP